MLSTGVKLALEYLGLRGVVVGGCERDACAAAAFLEWMEITQGSRPPVWDDAKTIFGRRCRGLEPVDVVCAGYPCQPFSSAGKRLGHGDPRHLWPAVRRIVARLQPGLVFFENVDGHVSMGLWKVLRDCERLGYRVTAGVYSAEEVGAPHLRKRVFILGVADSGWRGCQSWAGWERMCGTGEPVGSPTGRGGGSNEPERGADRGIAAGRAGIPLGEPNGPRCHGTRSGADDGSQRGGQCVSQSGRDQLAVGSGGRFGELRQSSRSDGQPDGSGVGQADTGSEQRQQGTEAARGRQSVSEYCESDFCHAVGQANGNQSRLEGGRPAAGMSGGNESTDGGCRVVPIYPPHRTDYRRWAELAALGLDATMFPAIESGVSVVADGLASSADLLRLGGNGVCPLTAAWAFLNLACCELFGMEGRQPAQTRLFD